MTDNDSALDLPTSPEALLARLEALGIAVRTVSHPPVFTVAEAKRLRGKLPGAHVKNLFLRDKKGRMWLLTCLEDRPLDLKGLGRHLGVKSLSFASAERLMTYLGVIPGAVTAFGIVNDRAGKVQVLLDQALYAIDPLNLHPLTNDRTTAIAPDDLIRFLEAEEHPPQLLDLDALCAEWQAGGACTEG